MRGIRSRRGIVSLLVAACLTLVPICVAIAPHTVASAASSHGFLSLQMGFSKDAYWYTGKEKMVLDLQLFSNQEFELEDVDVKFHLYFPVVTRSALESFREGKKRKLLQVRTLDSGIKVEPGTNRFSYAIDLADFSLSNGVYPYLVEVLTGGERLCERRGFLVIHQSLSGYPLNLVTYWNLHFPPSLDVMGSPLDETLAQACSGDPHDEGFLHALVGEIERFPGVKSTLSLPAQLLQELKDLASATAEGAEARGGVEGGQISGAKEVVEAIERGAKERRFALLPTAFGYANLEYLQNEGWEEDLANQIELGIKVAEELGLANPPEGFVAPEFAVNEEILGLLKKRNLAMTITSASVLARDPDGKALLEEGTPSQPVSLSTSSQETVEALVVDERIYRYLSGEVAKGSDQEIVENLVAELTALQAERPGARRVCVLAFPDSFLPSGSLLDELYGALSSIPWISPVFPEEVIRGVPALQKPAIRVPPETSPPPPLLDRLEEVRSLASSYSGILFEGNPLKEKLARSLLIAEGSDLLADGSEELGKGYIESIARLVEGDMSRIRVQEKGNVTLSSTRGELTIVVSNLNGYPVKGSLIISDTSVDFPDGSAREVVINPQENRFQFAVSARKKGSFLLDITLEGGGMVISRSSINLRTSSINTLALIFLVIMLALLTLNLALRKMRTWGRRGKHERRA